MSLLFITALWCGLGAISHGLLMRRWVRTLGSAKGAPHVTLALLAVCGPVGLLVVAVYLVLLGERAR